MRRLLGLVAIGAVTWFGIAGCDGDDQPAALRPQLLLYCGITMVHPMTEIARVIEREQNVQITISQGGSEDLYQSLRASRKGDLYLPGSESYRQRHLGEGLLGEAVPVGYNQAALVVRKGNPKQVSADPHSLLRQDLAVVICNPDSGSIGRENKRILEEVGIYQQVLDNAVFLTTDSRNMNGALKNGDADLILNWRATAFFPENRDFMEVIDIDPALAKPKRLVLNLLTFSSHPEIARRLMAYAASEQGQAVFRKYGFIDNQGRAD